MKYNKFSNKYLLAFLAVSAFAACTDLEVQEKDSIVVEDAGGGFKAGNPTDLLVASYKNLGTFTDQANIYALYEQPTDEMIPPTRGVDWGDNGVWRTLHTHSWDPTHSWVINSWNQLNERAFKCNEILASNPSQQEAAEAKFLRAFYTFHVMDLFGQVPFRDVNDGVTVNPKVLSRAEAFDFIVKDLNEALPQLPKKGPAAQNPQASQAAANALLARLYLNKAVYTAANPTGPYNFDAGDMAKVIEYADKVTADGYSLEDDYFTAFTTAASKETIFTSPEGTPQNRWFMTLHYNQDPSGWNGFTTLAEFYDKFEDGDQRKGKVTPKDSTKFAGIDRGFLIGQQYKDNGDPITDTRSQQPLKFTRDIVLAGAATEKGIRVIKYHPATAGQYILLRYADVYLMKAEALMRSGKSAEALKMVNDLRAKRSAKALSSLDEKAMLDERGRELYWEGVRRMDQVRFGTFDDTWTEKTTTDAFRVVYPIPQQALDSNPNLKQNDGY